MVNILLRSRLSLAIANFGDASVTRAASLCGLQDIRFRAKRCIPEAQQHHRCWTWLSNIPLIIMRQSLSMHIHLSNPCPFNQQSRTSSPTATIHGRTATNLAPPPYQHPA